MNLFLKNLLSGLIAVTLLLTAFLYLRGKKEIKTIANESLILQEELGYCEMEKSYLQELFWLNLKQPDNKTINPIYAYELVDFSRTDSIHIDSLLHNGKNKIIVRYTEIGCNSCVDSTFHLLTRYASLLSKYEIIVLVDFSVKEYYIKWRKITDINYPVFWLRRGDLPFIAEKSGQSYLFISGKRIQPSSFIIPDSKFSYLLEAYLINISEFV